MISIENYPFFIFWLIYHQNKKLTAKDITNIIIKVKITATAISVLLKSIIDIIKNSFSLKNF